MTNGIDLRRFFTCSPCSKVRIPFSVIEWINVHRSSIRCTSCEKGFHNTLTCLVQGAVYQVAKLLPKTMVLSTIEPFLFSTINQRYWYMCFQGTRSIIWLFDGTSKHTKMMRLTSIGLALFFSSLIDKRSGEKKWKLKR